MENKRNNDLTAGIVYYLSVNEKGTAREIREGLEILFNNRINKSSLSATVNNNYLFKLTSHYPHVFQLADPDSNVNENYINTIEKKYVNNKSSNTESSDFLLFIGKLKDFNKQQIESIKDICLAELE